MPKPDTIPNERRRDQLDSAIPPKSAIAEFAAAVAPAVPEQLLTLLPLRAMFMRPTHLERSARLEHIPFAFWMTEAHQPRVFVKLGSHDGSSYFASCEAAGRLGLDNWTGDEHTGFAKICAHNVAQYSVFSRLIRSAFFRHWFAAGRKITFCTG